MRLSLLFFSNFVIIILNAISISHSEEQVFPIWNEECAFANSEECTLVNLRNYLSEFKYNESKIDSIINKKTYVRFYVELDCSVSSSEVLRSCGDAKFDNQVLKYMSTIPDFYNSGRIGGLDTRFPFIVPFSY